MSEEIREALDRALSLIGELMSYDNFEAYPPYVQERVKDFVSAEEPAAPVTSGEPEEGKR